jgi:hypothetical protein
LQQKVLTGGFAPSPVTGQTPVLPPLHGIVLPPKAGEEGTTQLTAAAKEHNALIAAQNQLVDEVNMAWLRATKTAGELLEIRARALHISAADIAHLRYVQQRTASEQEQTRLINARQEAYETLYTSLESDLEAIFRAQEHHLTLEQAQEELTIARVARNRDEYHLLLALNDERRVGLALMQDADQAQQDASEALERLWETGKVQGLRESPLTQVRQEFDLLTESAAAFSSSFLAEITRVTDGAAFSFTRFADSAIQDLLRVLQQQVLQPQLGKWFELALQGISALARGYLGGGDFGVAGVSSTAGALSTAIGGGLAPTQTGGPLRMPGVNLVGEAGPEVIVSRGGHSMVYPTSHPLTRAALKDAGVPRRQYGGVLPSAVMGGTGSDAAMTTMGSGMGSGQGANGQAPVINVYVQGVQDAQSFIRSRGEIARSMQAAFRASHRS